MHDPREDLATIRRLMEESQRTVQENGKHFVVWGVLAAVGLVLTFLAVDGRVRLDPRWTWGTVLVLGWSASFWIGWRDSASSRVRTAGRRILTVVWVSTAVTLTLVGAAGLLGGAVRPEALAGLMAALIAPAFLATGALTGDRWLRWIAGAWWGGGAVMLFRPGPWTLVLLAVMALLLEVAPGVVLYTRWRRNGVGDAA